MGADKNARALGIFPHSGDIAKDMVDHGLFDWAVCLRKNNVFLVEHVWCIGGFNHLVHDWVFVCQCRKR